MNPYLNRSTTVTVVDTHPHDYAMFDPLVNAGRLKLHFLTRGRSALRQSRQPYTDLWMINVRLADIPGLDLFEMLASRLESVPVFMITDSYSADDEVRSLRLGATKYLCKPAALSWLATLRISSFNETRPEPVFERTMP